VKALIVDDEPLARRELRRLLAVHPEIEVVGEAGSAAEAERAIAALAPDLMFLDIQMPQRTGFQLLESLEDAPQVVFTTAYDEHALRAFEVGALDYLLKPIAPARLADALGRVRDRMQAAPRGEWLPADRPLLVREGERSLLVRLRDVAWIEAAGNYVQLHIGEHRPLLLHSMSALERRLDPDRFFRASRGALVNLDHVERFDTGVRGELIARLKGGESVPFSRRRSVEFQRRRGI
jgi:two-component system LytT family response regulator